MCVTEKETVIQFGEGNFLRGFADYFIQKLHDKGLFSSKVVLVKPRRGGSCAPFYEQSCAYNLFLYGLEGGKAVCEHTKINCISRIINPYRDWQSYLALAENPAARFIISNTTESGIVFDAGCKPGDTPPVSFPAKLTLLLYRRFTVKLPGFILLPCELIDCNGDMLKACVLKYADQWGLGAQFKTWVCTQNHFANTLVDRIVTGYPQDEVQNYRALLGFDDKLLVTAELYHRWVIEGNFENELPLQKAGFNVIWTDDVRPYKKQKVRILNGAHTSIALAALTAGLKTVGACMKDQTFSMFLEHCLFDEILPAMPANETDTAFANATLTRFENPYIKHRLSAIALNAVDKYKVRVLPSVLDYMEKFGHEPPCLLFALAALLYYYKNANAQDDAKIIAYMKDADIPDILKNDTLWGCDLTPLCGTVGRYYETICTVGIRKAIQCIL